MRLILKKSKFLLLVFLFNDSFLFASENNVQYGYASYYADKFEGNHTKSGEIFNQKLYTAAHATLPFNTLVKITHMRTKKTIFVKINDRCPKYPNRIIDLTKSAAKKLGILWSGIGYIKLEVISQSHLNMAVGRTDNFSTKINSDENLYKGMMYYMNGYMTPFDRHIVGNLIQYKLKRISISKTKKKSKKHKNKKKIKQPKRKKLVLANTFTDFTLLFNRHYHCKI